MPNNTAPTIHLIAWECIRTGTPAGAPDAHYVAHHGGFEFSLWRVAHRHRQEWRSRIEENAEGAEPLFETAAPTRAEAERALYAWLELQVENVTHWVAHPLAEATPWWDAEAIAALTDLIPTLDPLPVALADLVGQLPVMSHTDGVIALGKLGAALIRSPLEPLKT